MARKPGKGRGCSRGSPAAVRKVLMVLDDSESESDATPTKSQLVRIGLRQRWELASVLNFFKVFMEVIGQSLKMSAEEIETALIEANDDLALIHTSLLKGIPPVSKNLMNGDAWVTELSKTVSPWWPWVAEGENPLEAEKGEEIMRYQVLDPTTRLLILKALCEIRALQDDISSYITDGMKNGTPITAFRKERIGDEIAGITYWYDGDQVLGYRLYKEITKAESNQKNKGKGCLAQPTPESSWETLATNLKEFKKISDNLMSSKCSTEAAISEIVKTEVIPVLEKLQKKKSQTIKGRGLKRKALKQKRTQTLLLNDYQNSSGTGTRHSQRLQKLVKYTYDDYDRIIEEALRTPKKIETNGSVKDSNTKVQKRVGCRDSDKENHIQEGSTEKDSLQFTNSVDDTDETDDLDGSNGDDVDDTDETDDSDGSNGDDISESDNLGDSDDEVRVMDVKSRVMGLRRSRRALSNHGKCFDAKGTKKRPRLRATPPKDCSVVVISDSDGESLNVQINNEGESSASGSWGKINEQDNGGKSSTIGSFMDEPDSSDGDSSDSEE